MKLALYAVVLLTVPVAAAAQAANPGPFGGLFGATPDRIGRNYTVFEVRPSAGGFYSTAAVPDAISNQNPVQGAAGSSARATMLAERTSDRFTMSLSGGVAYEHYFVSPAYRATTYQASARVSSKVTTRINVDASLGYSHSPYFQFLAGLGAPLPNNHLSVPTPVAPATSFVENETYDANLGLSAQLGRNTTFDVRGYRRETRFHEQPSNNMYINGARGRLTHTVARGLNLFAGYGREESSAFVNSPNAYTIEFIDAGVDFNRQLSLSRKTFLGFSTSTTIIKDQIQRRLRINGSVSLTRNFKRTWYATVSANRGTEFEPGIGQPIFSDSVGASIGGLLSRRMSWMTGVSAGRGEIATTQGEGFTNVSANSTLSYGLSRNLGLFAQYSSYFYDVPAGYTTLAVPGRVERRVVSVGVSAYIPIYSRVRAAQ